MRLLVLQLSDIHIKTQLDFVLSRAGRIADAVKDLDHEVTHCVLALTGDIAYSGTAEQYAWAAKWVAQVRDAVSSALQGRASVTVAAIPGNHDCDFREPSPARAALLDAMLKDPSIAADPGSVAVFVQPQRPFFAFRDAVAADGLVGSGEVYYEYRIGGGTDANGVSAEIALVRCLNTAWASQNPEMAAKLVYPESLIVEDSGENAIVITLLHHPYNWLEPMNARNVRRAVQNVSDVILTGHEHAPGLHQQEDEQGATSLYIEGLALQGKITVAGPQSEFHAILLDTARRERRVVSFKWGEKSRYDEQQGPGTAWAPFAANPLRDGHAFPLSQKMRQLLSDPGLTLSHPTRGTLSLDDIFVYPDLLEVRYQPKAGQALVTRGERLLDTAVQSRRLLVTGTDDSGKSTLAKRLFIDALDAGFVPVLLNGRMARLRGDEKDRRELASEFEDQYTASGDAYLDTPTHKRILIIDDFASLRVSERTQPEMLEYLAHFAGTVVLFAHDVAEQVREIAGLSPTGGRTPFPHLRIMAVSHVRREEMIDRYISLAGSGDTSQTEALRAEMRRVLAMAVGRYHAPSVPVSVISILQTLAFNDQLNVSQATHGYYYELLIKRALYANTSQQEMDVRLSYLTDLAFAVYNLGDQQWSEAWFTTFHQRFVEDRRLALRFSDVVAALVEAQIIAPDGAGYRFRYRYIYYYFVSRALAARLPTVEGRAEIVRLTGQLGEQEPANILLFLTHHSKDAAIIDPMLAFANSLFEQIAPVHLDSERSELPEFELALKNAVYQDRPIEENRRDYMQRLDEADGPRDDGEESTSPVGSRPTPVPAVYVRSVRDVERDETLSEMMGFVGRIYTSFRVMQILGQLLKNFPGTLTGEQKERITRTVYGVGLRTLGAVHQLVRDPILADVSILDCGDTPDRHGCRHANARPCLW
jgi:hypothetical protein